MNCIELGCTDDVYRNELCAIHYSRKQAEQIGQYKKDLRILGADREVTKTQLQGVWEANMEMQDEIQRLKEENEHYREIINKGNHTIVLTEAAQPQGGSDE